MCVMIKWSDGTMLNLQWELDERVPEIFLKDEYPEETRGGEVCLCPVDVPTTLDNAGVEWERTPGIPDYKVTTQSSTQTRPN